MATKTANLALIKPARGEFEGTWDIPMNKNSDALDGAIGDIQTEIEDARGTAGSLTERLDEGLNPDGSVKDIPEIASARDSKVYGIATTLDERLESGDREIFDARQGAAALRDAISVLAEDTVHNSIQSAPPGFLSYTGAVVKCDGSITNVVVDINGYRQVVRTQKSVTIAGAAGTYYIYLQRSTLGELYLDRTGVGLNTGFLGTHLSINNKFTDSTQNFTTLGVQPGDILNVSTVGEFVVDSILSNTELLVKGSFESGLSNAYYTITNPRAPSLQFTNTAHSKKWQKETNLIYIGRAVFDGANVTSVTAYAAKGRFEQFIAVSALPFTQTISHDIGYVPKRIALYASQANDYSQDIEPMAISDMTASTLLRSMIVKMNDTTLSVKNTTAGTFYKSYDGTTYTTGYLLVIVER